MPAEEEKRYRCASCSPGNEGDASMEEASSDYFASETEASVRHTMCLSIAYSSKPQWGRMWIEITYWGEITAVFLGSRGSSFD